MESGRAAAAHFAGKRAMNTMTKAMSAATQSRIACFM
jgi:hypothetical protein